MAAIHPDKELIEERIAAIEAALEKGAVDEYMEFMADEISVSDFGPCSPFPSCFVSLPSAINTGRGYE